MIIVQKRRTWWTIFLSTTIILSTTLPSPLSFFSTDAVRGEEGGGWYNPTLPLLLCTEAAPTTTLTDDNNDDNENDEDDDILAEMMAEEQKEQDELAQLEAEMRELETLKAQRHEQQKQHQHQQQNFHHQQQPQRDSSSSTIPGTQTTNPQIHKLTEQLRQQESAQQSAQHEAQRLASTTQNEAAERRKQDTIAAQREAAFLAEMETLRGDAKKKKALERQKVMDARIVKRILRYSVLGRHYAVLGRFVLCRYGELQLATVPPTPVSNKYTLTLCKMYTPSQIKRTFRSNALRVHPDKNRDGRAEEAFRALEASVEYLSDGGRLMEYDRRLRLERRELVGRVLGGVGGGGRMVWEGGRWVKTVLGPLFVPVAALLVILL